MDKHVVGSPLLQEIKYKLIRQDTYQAETGEAAPSITEIPTFLHFCVVPSTSFNNLQHSKH